MVIPQQPDDIYLREAFREGLRTKMKMAIISMLRRTLVKMAESEILVEEKLHVRQNNMVKCCLNKFESEEYEDSANEDKHYKKKHKKNLRK